jgi:hypothetical protein|tara:strand:+ start:939 stop:1268 length:330 start_codon:yes stop_codon:yes gene_type:complete
MSSFPPKQSGPDLAQALLNVLRNVSHQDTTDYVLCLIVEMFVEDKTNAVYFHRAPGTHEGDAYADLFRVLAKPHWFAQEKVRVCVAFPKSNDNYTHHKCPVCPYVKTKN